MANGLEEFVDNTKTAITGGAEKVSDSVRHAIRHKKNELSGETQILPDEALDAYEDARDKISELIPKDVKNFFSDASDTLSEAADNATTSISNAIPKEVKEGVSSTIDSAKKTWDETTAGAGAILDTYTGNIDVKETKKMLAELSQDSIAFKDSLLKLIKEKTFGVGDSTKLDAAATALAYTKQTHEFSWKNPKTWVNSLGNMIKAAFSAVTKDFDNWKGFDGLKAQIAQNISENIAIDAEKNMLLAYPDIPKQIKENLLAGVKTQSLETAFAALDVDKTKLPKNEGNVRPSETPIMTASADKARTHG